jgi:hypothetical protein
MIRYSGFALMAILIVPFSSVFADDSGSQLSIIPNLEGEYENPEAGLKIVLPEGWKGVQQYGGFVTAGPEGVNIDPRIQPDVLMSIIPKSKVAYAESITKYIPQSGSSDVICNITEASFETINNLSTRKSIQRCEGSTYQITRSTEILSDKYYVGIFLSARTLDLYDRNVAAFEESLKTLEIKDAQDFRAAESSVLQLQKEYPVVTLFEKKTDVPIESNVAVTDFAFDEQKKQLTFHIEGKKDTRGIADIEISKVLEGPFTVLVDGKAIDTFATIDGQDRQFIRSYYDDASHDVTIIGTKAVPEFPVVIGALAAVMAAAILLGRKFRR